MWRDLRFALRTITRRPSLAAIVMLTMALGIGGSTAIFSVVNAVLLRDLPYHDAGRVYVVRALAPDGAPGNVSRREFAPFYEPDEHPLVESAALVWSLDAQIVGADERPYATVQYGVSDRFFDVLGTRMHLGRGFERDDRGGTVISYAVWRDLFESDPDIIGKPTSAGLVIGVTPAGFEFPEDPGFWTLSRLGAAYDDSRAFRGFLRLREGRSRGDLQNDLSRVAGELGPDRVTGRQPTLVADPMLDFVVGSLRPTVVLLFGATGILLLIACINVTNLLLSRTAVRSREVALREAIGAGRGRILSQLLTETLVLAAIGGVIGLAVAAAGVRVLLAVAPANLPRLDTVPLDSTVLLFALGVTLLTGLLVGLAPAWRLARNDLRSLINESGRGTPAGPTRSRVFSALVVAEIALAVVLVIGAGLLARSYLNLTASNPGFNPERLLTVTIHVSDRSVMPILQAQGAIDFSQRYMAVAAFIRTLEERLAGLSGIEAVATATHVPLGRGRQSRTAMSFRLPDSADAEAVWPAMFRAVSPDYFQTMGMRVLSGRPLARSDRPGAAGVAVVNEAFVRSYFPNQNPLGRRIQVHGSNFVPGDIGFQYGHLTVEALEVVGVVSDARYASPAQPPEPAIYLSGEQFIDRRKVIVLRSTVENPANLVADVRREIDAMDPLLAAQFDVFPTVLQASMARERFSMTLLLIFGAAALLLAAVGVYGLMSYSVAQRTGEIAVRSAFGASAREVVHLVMRRGLGLAVAGVVLGAAGAVFLRQVVAGHLFGVSALDLPVFATVTGLLFAVATLACAVPALRATRVDPANLLRSE